MTSGDKIMQIRCEDVVGNFVVGQSVFTIDIDDDAPEVVRAFNELGKNQQRVIMISIDVILI